MVNASRRTEDAIYEIENMVFEIGFTLFQNGIETYLLAVNVNSSCIFDGFKIRLLS